MKSCTFAGEDDELVLSGSDDFNLYVWRLSDIDCTYFKIYNRWPLFPFLAIYTYICSRKH